MIRYVALYGNEKCREKREYALSATTKSEYEASVFARIEKTEIVSASHSVDGPAPAYSTSTRDGVPVRMPASLGRPRRLKAQALNRFLSRVQLFWRLLIQTKKNDIVVAYHDLQYDDIIRVAKRIKDFHLILEINEFYGDVFNDSTLNKREREFFQIADGYIFATEFLRRPVDPDARKPNAINYGTFRVETELEPRRNAQSRATDKIDVVYAGYLSPLKGAGTAVAAAEFLDERYSLRIVGFGTDEEKAALLAQIAVTAPKTRCEIVFDGVKTGEDYLRYLQRRDVGLSVQAPDAPFNATSFPSKILSYMSNGLRVVSVRLPAVERSAVGDSIYFYDDASPRGIAEAIKKIDFNDGYDGREVVRRLDARYLQDVVRLFAAVRSRPKTPKSARKANKIVLNPK